MLRVTATIFWSALAVAWGAMYLLAWFVPESGLDTGVASASGIACGAMARTYAKDR